MPVVCTKNGKRFRVGEVLQNNEPKKSSGRSFHRDGQRIPYQKTNDVQNSDFTHCCNKSPDAETTEFTMEFTKESRTESDTESESEYEQESESEHQKWQQFKDRELLVICMAAAIHKKNCALFKYDCTKSVQAVKEEYLLHKIWCKKIGRNVKKNHPKSLMEIIDETISETSFI